MILLKSCWLSWASQSSQPDYKVPLVTKPARSEFSQGSFKREWAPIFQFSFSDSREPGDHKVPLVTKSHRSEFLKGSFKRKLLPFG
jgi:hypothetical protein